MSSRVDITIPELLALRTRRQVGEELADEAARLSGDLRAFTRAAWHRVVPGAMVPSWHIDTICEHVQAAYNREITRLLITIQPGSLKSSIVSVIAPAWQWTRHPEDRLVTGSWNDPLAMRDTRKSRSLILSPWYQSRWGDQYDLAADENLKGRYSNNRNGHRIATHVGGGTGERGDILQIDDPHNAKEAQTENQLRGAIEWYGDTWISRLNDSIDEPGVMIVIGQRIHENDLIAHIIELGGFTHLCLPARYVTEGHSFAPYPRKVKLPSGREIQGDVRTVDGELLSPAYTSGERLDELAAGMTAHVAAAQLQQLPTAREGDLLKAADWRYYPPRRDDETDEEFVARMPRFTRIVESWDTPLKERETNDLIAGQCYGEIGADRYMLDCVQGHMNYSAAKRAVLEMAGWARRLWPDVEHRILIEKGGYGLDLALELKREITGIVVIPEKGDRLPDKYARAESASAALESGNVFLPGHAKPDLTGPDEARCPAMTTQLVATCAAFPNGRYKDPVDSWSQAMNWLGKHVHGKTTSSVPRRSVVMPTGDGAVRPKGAHRQIVPGSRRQR